MSIAIKRSAVKRVGRNTRKEFFHFICAEKNSAYHKNGT